MPTSFSASDAPDQGLQLVFHPFDGHQIHELRRAIEHRRSRLSGRA